MITGGKLGWNAMPADEYGFRRRLMDQFPHEHRAIRRYFRDLRKASSWVKRDSASRFLPGLVGFFSRLSRIVGKRRARETTQHLLDRYVQSDRLKAVLTSQWGDYGLPPGESA